ncbi:hypothetical protein PSDVSF_29030 [Pseudodesulfovibrio sediminis]|uniref:Uncharacterized protein n=1 Tax=Pseudodesulfovibrio sediminis TaxID=2810563 RepID=A0ABM7P9J1_9BACT|nr:hypothetical protein PSDVSF_29030 [Pseudodesulfovibrio sediminis]
MANVFVVEKMQQTGMDPIRLRPRCGRRALSKETCLSSIIVKPFAEDSHPGQHPFGRLGSSLEQIRQPVDGPVRFPFPVRAPWAPADTKRVYDQYTSRRCGRERLSTPKPCSLIGDRDKVL